MARLRYPEPFGADSAPLVERIKHERGGKLLNLYKMLLHSPSVAEGWLAFLTAVRQRTTVQGRYRELVILRVAVLNGADYEFRVHVPFALREGIGQAAIDSLRSREIADHFDDAERAVISYTDSMTRDIHVPDDVFAKLREHFSEAHVVELTATVAAYNCVSRFLEALRIEQE